MGNFKRGKQYVDYTTAMVIKHHNEIVIGKQAVNDAIKR